MEYPKDHKVGMEVPRGGSSCNKCEYLKDYAKRLCGEKHFIQWDGENKPAGSNKIPLPVDEYCCDLFEIPKPPGANPIAALKGRLVNF